MRAPEGFPPGSGQSHEDLSGHFDGASGATWQLTPAKIEVLLCPQHSKLQSAEPFMFDHFSRIRTFADRARHEKPKTKPLKTCGKGHRTGGQEFGPCYQCGGTHYFSLRHDEADCTDRWNHGQPIGASPTRHGPLPGVPVAPRVPQPKAMPEAELGRGRPRGQHHSCPDNH